MILWVFFAVLTALVVGTILMPLSRDRGRSEDTSDGSYDLTVYRDQLSEIEHDRERGLVSAEAAEASRAELAQRIFHHVDVRSGEVGGADKLGQTFGVGGAPREGVDVRRLVLAIGAFLPLMSVGLYVAIGSPGVPGKPFVASVVKSPEQSDVEKLVGQVEARLREKPLDGRGWDVLAPVYARLGMFEDARVAYGRALALLGPSKERLLGLGRTAIRASDGIVTDEAQLAFEQYLELDPSDLEARLWLARAKEQGGDIKGAIAAFEEMLASSKKDAKWRTMIEERIAKLRSSLNGAGVPDSGNKTEDSRVVDGASAVSEMSEEQKAKFISNMVERLATRLSKDGGSDFDGWTRLVHAYVVLGRTEEAKKALADARARFGDDEVRAKDLDALAKKYELGS